MLIYRAINTMAKPNIPEAQRRAKELLQKPLKDFCGMECATFLCTAPYMANRQLTDADLTAYASDMFEYTPGGSKHEWLNATVLDPNTATVADALMQIFRRDEEDVFANAAQLKAFAARYPDEFQQNMDEHPDKKKFAGLIMALDTLARGETLTKPKQIPAGLKYLQEIHSLTGNMNADLTNATGKLLPIGVHFLGASQHYPEFLTPLIRELIAIKKDLGLGHGGRSRGGDDTPKES